MQAFPRVPHESRVRSLARFVSGARTRYLTILVWLALALVLGFALPPASRVEAPNPSNFPPTAPSVIASNLQQRAFGKGNLTPGLLVFYRAFGLTPSDIAGISRYLTLLSHEPLPEQAGPPPYAAWPPQELAHLTRARETTLVIPLLFHPTGSPARYQDLLTSLQERMRQAFGQDLLSRPLQAQSLVARFTGPMGIAADTSGLFKHADVTLLAGTTLLILVLLVLIYRSPLLPFIPLASVGLSYFLVSALLGALAQAHRIVIDAESVSIMTVLMFGAGTDYTLLVISRYREYLSQVEDHGHALRRALEDSAGAIAMSAGTVMLALLALLLSRYGEDQRFAVPFVLGVGITAVASLTLVPALLAVLGRAAFFPRVPRPGVQTAVRSGLWIPLVERYPWPVLVATVALLGVFAGFAPGIRTSFNLLDALPKTSGAVEGFRLLARAEGPGSLSPVTLLVRGPGASVNLTSTLLNTPGVQAVAAPRHAQVDHRPVAEYSVTLAANPFSNAALAILPRLRAHVAKAVGAQKDTRVYLAGPTAQNADATSLLAHDTRLILPVVLGTIAILLLLYLGSVVAALYLIATVVLSFAASIGLGWIVLHDILGVSSVAGGVVLYAFVFLVALGEDYNIFMVSRIWQEREARPMREAVLSGMRATGPVITAAGLILAGTFLVLTGLPLQILLDFGVVTAIGVLVDTFVVRSALVPAITYLLGDRAMWPRSPQRSGASTPQT